MTFSSVHVKPDRYSSTGTFSSLDDDDDDDDGSGGMNTEHVIKVLVDDDMCLNRVMVPP